MVGFEHFEDVLRVVGTGVFVADARQIRITMTVIHLVNGRGQRRRSSASGTVVGNDRTSIIARHVAGFASGDLIDLAPNLLQLGLVAESHRFRLVRRRCRR